MPTLDGHKIIDDEGIAFRFFTREEPFHERELETGLVRHLEKFLVELGQGFAFVGRQAHRDVGEEDFYIRRFDAFRQFRKQSVFPMDRVLSMGRTAALSLGLAAWVAFGSAVFAQDGSQRIPELIRQLRTGDAPAQVAAADELAKRGDAAQPAVPALLDSIRGQSSWVDNAMAEALSELAPVSLPYLLERLQNGDADIRQRALRGMMGMGARLREARPILQKAAADENENVRRTALRILQGLDAAAAQTTNAVPVREVGPRAIGAIRPSRSAAGRTSDWPGFRGAARDGLCMETGLLQDWPAAGPTLLWRLDTLGNGLSSVSIAGGRLYATGDRETKDGKSQYVLAYDLGTRAELWATRVGGAYPEHGALSTPTVDGDRLYVTTTDGGVFCLRTATGEIGWQKSMTNDFGGAMMSRWQWSESPLVDGEKMICTPGGSNAMMVALNKMNGDVIWKCVPPRLGERGKDGAGYCSAVVAEVDGVRQYVQAVGRGVVGVAADSGKFLWGYNRLANTTANIPGPIVRGREVFTANGYNTGCALLRLQRQGDVFGVEEVYVLPPTVFQNHHGGYVLVGDYVYGGSGSNKGEPTCLEFATGRLMWKAKSPIPGSACVLYADGRVVFRFDRGLLALVEATPESFRVKGSFTPPRSDRAAWSYPAIHDGKLYVRDQNLLLCYDVRSVEPRAGGTGAEENRR